MEEGYLTACEVAKKYNASAATVRRWCRDGLIPDAILKTIPPFGSVWLIPEFKLRFFKPPKNGRPKHSPKEKRRALIIKLYEKRYYSKPSPENFRAFLEIKF